MAAPTKKSPEEVEALIAKLTAEGRKIRVAQKKKLLSTGVVHVYEVRTYYDPKTRNTKVIDSKLLGKLPAGSSGEGEMIPTDKKYAHGKSARRQAAAQQAADGLASAVSAISASVKTLLEAVRMLRAASATLEAPAAEVGRRLADLEAKAAAVKDVMKTITDAKRCARPGTASA